MVDQYALNQVMVKLDQIEDDIFNSQLSDADLNELNDLIQVTKEQLENDPKRVEGLQALVEQVTQEFKQKQEKLVKKQTFGTPKPLVPKPSENERPAFDVEPDKLS